MRIALYVFLCVLVLSIFNFIGYAWAEVESYNVEEIYPILKVLRDVKFSGMIDAGFNYNFNQPDSRSNSDLRVFDRRADSFTIHLLELSLSKVPKDADFLGYKIDLDFGKDANIIAPSDTDSSDEFDLQEAYIHLKVPNTKIEFKTGKFVTLLGAEVIEAPFNLNYSRSFLFGLAIPFTHTGILASLSPLEEVSLQIGVVNGWDVIEDNNDAKSILGSLSYTPHETFSFAVNWIWGAEQDDNNSSKRAVFDIVSSIKPLNDITFTINYDYGVEEDAMVKGRDSFWTGIAGYLQFDYSKSVSLVLRAEYFNDDDGARTGISQDLWEVTLTGMYKLSENVIIRVEYRHDESNSRPFIDQDGASDDSQDTVGFELAYMF